MKRLPRDCAWHSTSIAWPPMGLLSHVDGSRNPVIFLRGDCGTGAGPVLAALLAESCFLVIDLKLSGAG